MALRIFNSILVLLLLVAIPAQATTSIYLPNVNSSVTGTNLGGGHYGMDISGTISATNPSVSTNGSTAPTSSTEIGWIDGTGKLQGVSATNPLPISGTVSASNPSVGTTASAVPASGTYVAGNKAGNLTGLLIGQQTMANSLACVLPSDQSAIPASQSGTWTVAQGSAAALASAWPVKVTDGTNSMPTMDAAARAGFHKITDGTNTAAVKAASTAAVATDPALVVAISPNNTVAATQSGTWTVQPGNTPNTTPWLAKISDGTNAAAIKAASTAAVATDPALVVAVSPNNTLPANITQVGGSAITLGSKVSASSFPVVIASDQGAVATKMPLNSTASAVTNTTITTTPSAITASTNSVEVLVQANDTNTANLRVSIGTTCSSSLGIQLQPGRSETFHTSQNLSVCSESGTQTVNVQWLAQ